MNLLIFTYLFIYACAIGGVVLVGFILHLRKSKRVSGKSAIASEEITVLVPFRNEEMRIGALLESILKLEKMPNCFVFIDDHSTDGSCALISKKLNGLPFEICSLEEQIHGKKQALRMAIDRSDTKYILTFDADVELPPNYFNDIELLEETDMYVLPAILVGQSPMEMLYELDVVLANGLNTGLSGINRPIFCSGANLLFKRDVFSEVDDLASHAHKASGDDTYLLRDFRKNRKDVRLVSNLNVAVFTETPHSFKEFIDQRLRWVGKTTDIGDPLATASAFGQFMLAIIFIVLLIVCGIYSDWNNFTLLFIGKICMDLVFFLPFFLRTERFLTWSLIPVYELLFPFYSLLLGILMLIYTPSWKGRSIK